MIDLPQQPIDAVRWRERMEDKAPIRYLINTEPHGDHISGNAYFPNITVVGQVKLQECFERYLYAFGSLEEKRERFKETNPDSVFLVGHPDYPAANPPDDDVRRRADPAPSATTPSTSSICRGTRRRRLQFTCRRKASSSPATTSFTNAGAGCKNVILGEWLEALEEYRASRRQTIIPGHGEPCSKAYLKEQGQIVELWIGYIEKFVDRELTSRRDIEASGPRSPSRIPIRSASAFSSMTSG